MLGSGIVEGVGDLPGGEGQRHRHREAARAPDAQKTHHPVATGADVEHHPRALQARPVAQQRRGHVGRTFEQLLVSGAALVVDDGETVQLLVEADEEGGFGWGGHFSILA